MPNPTALELNSNGVVETLGPEPNQTQTIIKVVFKFLTGLMPILTRNTHVTVYLEYLKQTRRDPMIKRWKNMLTEKFNNIHIRLYQELFN